MKIKGQRFGSVTTYYQTIEVEDGPFIDAGPSYVTGTQFKVEKIKRRRFQDKPWGDVTVEGLRLQDNGQLGIMVHSRVFAVRKGLPKWLFDILKQGLSESILEGAAEEVDVEDQIDKEIHEALGRGEQ